jgi:hypothetical protein
MVVKLSVAGSFGPRHTVRLLDPEQREAVQERNVLFKALPSDFAIKSYERVETIPACDFVILPQALRTKTAEWQRYFEAVRREAEAAGKRIIVFIGRDDSHKTHVDGAIVFKGSDYRHARRENEIILSPFVEDLGDGQQLRVREKGEKPIVSFCGYAGFPDAKTHARYVVKNALLDIASLYDPRLVVYKRGIYFRKAAMRALSAEPRIETAFILRDSYGGNKGTLTVSPEASRREYIASILESDLVLAPKGDANFSSRFFEALSLGRIPILIDTDMELPLEREIDYSACILRISYEDVPRLGEIVVRFWQETSPQRFAVMQLEARRVFREYLRYDAYFNRALPLLKEKGIAALQGRAC